MSISNAGLHHEGAELPLVQSRSLVPNHAHSGMDEFLDILKPLVREPSVVGVEDSSFRVLRRELEELGVQVNYYHGVLVAQGSRPNDLYLSAHIDRHGLLCTGPNEFEYAAFIAGNQGENMIESVSEHMLHQLEDRFAGQRVQAHLPYTGTYLGQGRITRSYVCPRRKNLIFEVDGLSFLQPGTPVSFLDRLKVENELGSCQLDNVVSAALIIYLFRKGFQGTGHVHRPRRVRQELALRAFLVSPL